MSATARQLEARRQAELTALAFLRRLPKADKETLLEMARRTKLPVEDLLLECVQNICADDRTVLAKAEPKVVLTDENKVRVRRLKYEHGMKPSEIAARFNVTTTSIYRALREAKAE